MLLQTILLFLLYLTASSSACGGFFCAPQQPVVQSGEAIIFGVQDRTVTMHIQINYQGPAEDFSWLLPVMFEPTVLTSSDPFFQSMFRQTLPQFQFRVEQLNDSTACAALGDPCAFFDAPAAPEAASGDDAQKGGLEIQEGSVGPFDFTIIKALNNTDVDAVRTWLSDNGYDEYVGSVPIIAHYVKTGHYFVALRLKKDTDAGDLVPIALQYEIIPADMETMACIPLILTAVAATESMPIQVYILGDSVADPVNYFRVELDDTKVDWLGCQNNPSCFDIDYRARAAVAFEHVNDHAFVEEYAGPADVMKDQIRFDINATELAQSASVLDFVNTLAAANVPAFGLLDGIFNDYIPLEFTNQAPFLCASQPSIYTPNNVFQMGGCVSVLAKRDQYDLAGLAAEIAARVLEPAAEAQDYVDSFTHLTRLWVSMRQEKMSKDPFFRFRPNDDRPNRSNVHSAVAVPACNKNQRVTDLSIQVDGGATTMVPATLECGVFRKTNFDPLYGLKDSPALQLVVPGFGVTADRMLVRQEDGTFDEQAILDSFTEMDGRVMDQTIAPYPSQPVSPSASPPTNTSAAPSTGLWSTLWAASLGWLSFVYTHYF